MRRRRPGERVERFRMRDVREASEELRAKLAQWGEGPAGSRHAVHPGRAQRPGRRLLEPLLAVGESAGDRWAARSREAALALSGGEVAEEDSLGVRLLADCRAVFDSCDEDSLASDALIARLIEREEAPGATSSASRSPPANWPTCCGPMTCDRATGAAAAAPHAATSAGPSNTLGRAICVLKRHNRHRCRFAGVSTITKRHRLERCAASKSADLQGCAACAA